jgi:two-component system cell cycle sensor histidine kinase/response regulator CckA
MNSKQILIIDNNMVMVKLMTSFLDEQGHQTRTACDAFEALDMLKDYTPDIIFIDLIMPKISGDILCRMLRTITHLTDCYIVIISATLAEQDLDLRKIGANGAIAKGPFTKMSTYILESIEESEDKSLQAAPQIKGSEDFPARHITKELIRRNQHLQKLLEGMSQGVIELEDDRVLFVNNAVETFLKTKKEILLGSYLSEQLDSETWNTLDPKISQHNSTFDEDEKDSSVKLFGKHIIVHCLKFDENHRKQILPNRYNCKKTYGGSG